MEGIEGLSGCLPWEAALVPTTWLGVVCSGSFVKWFYEVFLKATMMLLLCYQFTSSQKQEHTLAQDSRLQVTLTSLTLCQVCLKSPIRSPATRHVKWMALWKATSLMKTNSSVRPNVNKPITSYLEGKDRIYCVNSGSLTQLFFFFRILVCLPISGHICCTKTNIFMLSGR